MKKEANISFCITSINFDKRILLRRILEEWNAIRNAKTISLKNIYIISYLQLQKMCGCY